MRIPTLICLMHIISAQETNESSTTVQRRTRIMKGRRVSQIGSFSCFRLQWDTSSKFENIVDARLTYVEADNREIPVPKSAREVLERSSIALPTSPVCISIHAEHLKAAVVLYTIGEPTEAIESGSSGSVAIPPTAPAAVVTTRHWLQRYEEILREADPERKLFKSAPLGSCDLLTTEMSTVDLLPSGVETTPAKFRQGICRVSCFIDPVSRRKRCCKPAKLEDLEASSPD